MPSSHKIIKRNHSFSEDQLSFIQTDFAMPVVATLPEETEGEPKGTIDYEELASAKAALSAAIKAKEDVLSAAQQEAEALKSEAIEKGFSEGQKKGYEEGYQTGYHSGMQKAQEESIQLKENIQHMLMEAEAFVERYYKEQKEALLDLAGHMAETIVHATIDASSEQVMDLVKPVIHRLRRENQLITLSVRPEQSQLVKEKVKELEKEHPEIRFAVLTDNTLDKNGCTIESAHAIIDLQVRKQLDAMLMEMKEME